MSRACKHCETTMPLLQRKLEEADAALTAKDAKLGDMRDALRLANAGMEVGIKEIARLKAVVEKLGGEASTLRTVADTQEAVAIAASKLCRTYFTIAERAIGEDEVRRLCKIATGEAAAAGEGGAEQGE